MRNNDPKFTLLESSTIDHTTGCWVWEKCLNGDGYPVIWVNKKRWKGHRLSFFIFYGQDPGKLLVCHACDNRKCINPDHLWLGTHLDNNRDCINKNRMRHPPNLGEKHGMSKFTDDLVRLIRKEYSTGVTQTSLAKKYKCHQATIGRIVTRVRWKHIA